jgi:hypothetical protein
MKQTNLHENNCLSCGRMSDVASSVFSESAPSPGDFTICLYCGHVMAFGDDLGFRALTGAEMISVAGDVRVLKIQAARKKYLKK